MPGDLRKDRSVLLVHQDHFVSFSVTVELFQFFRQGCCFFPRRSVADFDRFRHRKSRRPDQVFSPAAAADQGNFAGIFPNQFFAVAQQRLVVGPAETAVPCQQDITDPFVFRMRLQIRVVAVRCCLAGGFGQHVAAQFGIAFQRCEGILCLPQFRSRDHLHRFCDLAGILDTFDARTDRAQICHALTSFRGRFLCLQGSGKLLSR